MNRPYRAFITLTLLAALALGCQRPAHTEPATRDDSASAPPAAAAAEPQAAADPQAAAEAALARVTTAWNAHDMVGFGAVFAEDATFINIFGHQLVGRDMITEHHAKLHQRHFRDTQLLPERTEVTLLDGDTAIGVVGWRLEGARDPRTDEPVEATTGLMTATLRRAADGWLIVALQNGRTLPIPGR
ncbi:MAG: hypothetical protein Tsb0020_26270 [Haliangiales bacterium]